jgi:uncharacterized repeat protein (TIGR03837 family)
MLWDIFCKVIDNLGDIGVCWRLSANLAARGQCVRLWVDDGSALHWMAPGALEGQWPGIQVRPWEQALTIPLLQELPRADVWIEAFGCDLPQPFVAHYAQPVRHQAAATETQPTTGHPVWLNLEYLSAEPYVERCHGLPSPVLQGPAKGWTKTFFYPGFTAKTGGLLREPAVAAPWHAATTDQRRQFFNRLGIHNWQGERMVSLFCYEPPLLKAMLDLLASAPDPTRLLVTAGRASQAVRALMGNQSVFGPLQISYLPAMPQTDFDTLLACCDLNFVRGEDSVLRALWTGQPFVWQIYPQQDLAHAAKLEAFMEQMQWSEAVRNLHRAWNDLPDASPTAISLLPLRAQTNEEWRAQVHAARQRLTQSEDLVSKLLQFVLKNR